MLDVGPRLRRESSDCSRHALSSLSCYAVRKEKTLDLLKIPWGVLTAPEMILIERLLTTQPGADPGPGPLRGHLRCFILSLVSSSSDGPVHRPGEHILSCKSKARRSRTCLSNLRNFLFEQKSQDMTLQDMQPRRAFEPFLAYKLLAIVSRCIKALGAGFGQAAGLKLSEESHCNPAVQYITQGMNQHKNWRYVPVYTLGSL